MSDSDEPGPSSTSCFKKSASKWKKTDAANANRPMTATERKRKERQAQTEEKKKLDKEKDRVQKADARKNASVDSEKQIAQENAEQHTLARANLSEERR